MQVLCGLQVVFFLFNCQTPVYQRLAREFPDSPAELFAPSPLVYRAKKQGPMTPAQKGYLNDLIKYHKISSLTHSKRKKRYNR